MRWLRLVLLVFVLPLAGCALNARPTAYLVDTKGPYLLDTGDVVRVTVYGDDMLSNSYRIDDSGAVAFPLVGPVVVRGKTTAAAAAAIAAGLAQGYMRNPDVVAEIAEYRPYFIQGAVNNAGQFPYVYGMTVRAAISTAGGFSGSDDQVKVIIYRQQGDEMVRAVVSLDFAIFPGDTIVVSERRL